MLCCATEADLPAILAFLAPRVATSMFLSSNLRDFGLGQGRAEDHPKSMTLWYSRSGGEITNVLGYAKAGYLVYEAPNLTPDLLEGLQGMMQGRLLRGANGAAEPLATIASALRLPLDLAVMDEIEPLYRLELTDLVLPPGKTYLRSAGAEDLDLLIDWRMRSEVEILGARDTRDNRELAAATLRELLKADRLRVLQDDGQPVAMTNFNAALPEIVQVGGVYTPPSLRGLGYARQAVALHLQEARTAGVSEAILFAANPAASRAYEAIGFVRRGSYRIVNFDPAVYVGEIS